MKVSDIEELAHKEPFRSFSLETDAGESVFVANASDIFISPRRRDIVIVFTEEGRMKILDLEHIASVQTR